MFDCAIIGTGPAGISAALTLKARNKSFIWFGNKDLSLKVSKAERIRNYPGLINVTGSEMVEVFTKQIKDSDITITDKIVTGVYDLSDHYGILCNQDMYEAKTIILATGVTTVKAIPGEEENLGSGVSYCATCDGFLYKGKEIMVVAQNESYLEEVDYLADLASRIYLVPLFKNCDYKRDNVTIVNKKPLKIEKKEGLDVSFDADVINVSGVFFLKSSISANVLVPGLEMKDGHVLVNRMCETNLKGCFAAGDITGKPYQYTKAVGEGNICAHSVVAYLAKETING